MGAAASAAVYSIVETAKANGLNPYKYLNFIFTGMPGVLFKQYPEFLEDFFAVELGSSSRLQTELRIR